MLIHATLSHGYIELEFYESETTQARLVIDELAKALKAKFKSERFLIERESKQWLNNFGLVCQMSTTDSIHYNTELSFANIESVIVQFKDISLSHKPAKR